MKAAEKVKAVQMTWNSLVMVGHFGDFFFFSGVNWNDTQKKGAVKGFSVFVTSPVLFLYEKKKTIYFPVSLNISYSSNLFTDKTILSNHVIL